MLLVGTTHGLRDLDTGDTVIEGRAVTALAVSPGTTPHALLDRRFVVRLEPGAGDGVLVGELPEADGQSLAVLPDGTVVTGRAGARLAVIWADGTSGELRAFEGVPGRGDWENPAGPTPDTRTMALGGSGRLWVNVHVGGVWWSDDAGQTWQGAVEPEADVHEVRAATGPDALVAVAAAVGFGWSEDGGRSWLWTTDGLHGAYLRAVALDGDSVLVSASDGPFTKQGAVYRGRLGAAFARCEGGLPERFPGNVDSGHLDAADGRVAVGFADHVYISEDEGHSWLAPTGLPGRVTAVRFAPA